MTNEENKLTTRMWEKGDYIIVGKGGHFWTNANHPGCLIEAVDHDDIVLVQKLANSPTRSLGIRYERKTFKIRGHE